MKEITFSVNINAPKEKVWDTLWQDKTFREWAGIIDEGTYMTGDLKQGHEVQFISSVNGYGVTSLVEKLAVHDYLLLKHLVDTQGQGKRKRENEWTGGQESYSLVEKNGITVLTITLDVPYNLQKYFKVTYPKALERVKALSERRINSKDRAYT